MDERHLPPTLGDAGEPEQPSVARMYDYYLGGHHNFASDRAAAAAIAQVYPDVSLVAQANRAFLRRVVRFLVGHGVTQFLDIGSGIPTIGNVHEVARDADPRARVVYVDSDPVAVRHSRAILADDPGAAVIRADARHPAAILAHPATRELLDRTCPLAVLLITFLHFIPDDAEAYRLVRTFVDALAPGSYLAIAHGTVDGAPPAVIAQVERLYTGTTHPVKFRPRAAIAPFFAGLTLVDPGLVFVPRWRPEADDDLFLDDPACSLNLVGVGRKA